MNEIEKLIIKYENDPENTQLIEYYESDNLWKTLRIERDENKHSAFIGDVLKKNIGDKHAPLRKLLNLLIIKSESNECPVTSNDLQIIKESILSQKLRINGINVELEKTISSLSNIRYADRLDIYITCDISGIENYSYLEIFIENKVDSSENGAKTKKELLNNQTDEEQEYSELYQTERYFFACSKTKGNRKDNESLDKTLQLFVYLSPNTQKAKENNFINISYQDLVDYILEPYLKRDGIDEYSRFTINEYLKILGNPFTSNNKTALAMTKTEKELLVEFYNRNVILFERALDAMIDSTEDDPDLKKHFEDAKENVRLTTGVRRYFSINGDGEFKMYQVVGEFAKHLLDKGEEIDTIEEIIKYYTQEDTRLHISEEKNTVYRNRNGKHEYDTEKNGKIIYVTKEWGMDGRGKNFSGLLKGINEQYEDFQIAEIKK